MTSLRDWRLNASLAFPIPQAEFDAAVDAFLTVPKYLHEFGTTRQVHKDPGRIK